MENKRRIKLIVLGLLLTLCLMIGTSYALWTTTTTQSGINEIQSDCLNLSIENDHDKINLENAYPLTDTDAKKLKPYTFTVKNKCHANVNFAIKLEKLQKANEETLDSQYVAVEFNGAQKQILSDYPQVTSTYAGNDYKSIEARNLINGTLKDEESRTYTLKLWMDEHVTIEDDVMDKTFVSKIVIDGNMNHLADFTEPILHGADPVLEDNSKPVAMLTANEVAEVTPTTPDTLIPVIIEENGTVTKADTKEEWYNYEEKRWANAIILADNSKADTIKVGDVIPESDIESYFVWIPKYKYKLFNLDKYTSLLSLETAYEEKSQPIEIQFDLEDTKDENPGECTTPNKSGEDGNCQVGDWMTHPAFTAFSGSKGMWVGKFETGYNQSTNNLLNDTTNWNMGGAERNENAPTKVIIKPNVYSWRRIKMYNMFYTSYEYQRELDSHMMKNTEWGAVAYLTTSNYGRCENGVCTEIMINNSSNMVTGYAAKEAPTLAETNSSVAGNWFEKVLPNQNGDYEYHYGDANSQVASTTGNYSGVYDMSGSAWEFVAGVLTTAQTVEEISKENIDFAGSELTAADIPDLKYIDLYLPGGWTNYNHRILGDATGEMGPFKFSQYGGTGRYESSWFHDQSSFAYNANGHSSWHARGGSATRGLYSGIFHFGSGGGEAHGSFGFRIVLTP